MTGVLTLVQEERFQLLDDGDQRRFFALSRHAPVEPAQLQALRASGARVSVEYEDVPDMIVHVAHRITRLDERNSP